MNDPFVADMERHEVKRVAGIGHNGADRAMAMLAKPKPAALAIRAWELPAEIDSDEWLKSRPAPDCIVADYLYADIALQIAPGGTGKTSLTLFEAVHIVLSLPLYGLEIRRPGPVLILTAEDSREMLVARLRSIVEELRLTPAQTKTVMQQVRIADVSGNGFKLTEIFCDMVMPAANVDQIIASCRELKPVLIVIDPAISFGVGESRVNDAEQGLIEAGRKLRRALNCCVRFVHHSGKQNARDRAVDQYAGRGGSAFADGARMVAVLQAMTSDEWLTATGAELAEGETGLRLARPKLSYAPPAGEIYIRRRGYSFQRMSSTINGAGALVKANADMVWRLLDSELEQGRYHSRNSLESLETGLRRGDLRKAVELLGACCRVEDRTRPSVGKGGASKYLHPIASPVDHGEPMQKSGDSLAVGNSIIGSPPPKEKKSGEPISPVFPPPLHGSPREAGEAMANLANQ